MVIGETNNVDGFSVEFSEPVNAVVVGWRGVLVPLQSRPDPALTYNRFNFELEIQPGFDEVYILFGVRRSNNAESMYKATYDSTSETWSLAEFTLIP